VALLEARGFTAQDFARSHPGGSLGRRLLLHVADVMHRDEQIPQVAAGVPLSEALLEMSRKGLGMTAVVAEGRVTGVFTDGDLRRALDRGADVRTVGVDALMTRNPVTVPPDLLAAEALALMEGRKINALLVTKPEGRLVGALNMHDLLRARVV
jgi:arabinose-5-phosphate isomerase